MGPSPTAAIATTRKVGADVATAVIMEKSVEAEGIVTLELASGDGARLPDWAPGAHIDLILPNGLTRQYSLCGDRWVAERYRIGVLREETGRGGSSFIHEHLTVGDSVGLGGPRNNFPLFPSDSYLFIAGGIGITPIVPMLRQADMLGADWRLLYGGRRRSSMAFVDELVDTFGDRVLVMPQDECGLLNVSGFLGAPRPGVKIYACGPIPLLDAISRSCAPWPQNTLHVERFLATDLGQSTNQNTFRIELARSGVTLDVQPHESILDVARSAGVEILSSCQQGTCGTCETTVLEGRPEHRDSILNDFERESNDCMFPCVSRSRSKKLVLDL